jgi:acyl-CoA synthetase (NDP forming)
MADSLDDTMEIAIVLSDTRRFGPRMAIATVSGGLGGVLADSLTTSNVIQIPAFTPETASILEKSLDAFLDVRNPLDVGGAPFRQPGLFGDTLIAIANDHRMDSLIVALTPLVSEWCEQIVEGVLRARRNTDKAFAVLWQAGTFCEVYVQRLRENGVPVFSSTGQCATVLSRIVERRPLTYRSSETGSRRALSSDSSLRAVLDEAESKRLLADYLPRAFATEISVAIDDANTLIDAAHTIGFPVVLKAMMEGAHKSELGLVVVGVHDEKELRQVAARQLSSISRAGGVFRGFLVAEFVQASAELLVGVTRDDEFGPVITVGAGGIYAELFDDVSVRVLPVSEDEFRQMIDECRVSRILKGARGKPPLDIDGVIKVMKGLSAAAFDLGEKLNAIEINPLAVLEKGEGVRVLDAKAFLRLDGDVSVKKLMYHARTVIPQ